MAFLGDIAKKVVLSHFGGMLGDAVGGGAEKLAGKVGASAEAASKFGGAVGGAFRSAVGAPAANTGAPAPAGPLPAAPAPPLNAAGPPASSLVPSPATAIPAMRGPFDQVPGIPSSPGMPEQNRPPAFDGDPVAAVRSVLGNDDQLAEIMSAPTFAFDAFAPGRVA